VYTITTVINYYACIQLISTTITITQGAQKNHNHQFTNVRLNAVITQQWSTATAWLRPDGSINTWLVPVTAWC